MGELTQTQIKTDMAKVEKLIIKLENFDEKGELTASVLRRFQEELDKLADKYQYDARVGKEKSYFYELQALILLAKGEEKDAETAMETAAKVSGDPPSFISDTAKKWYRNKGNNFEDNQELPSREIEQAEPVAEIKPRKFNGKLEGWLVLYSLTFLLVPILLIVDLVGTGSTLNGLEGTQYYDQLNGILNFARTYDVLQLVSLTVFGYLFFTKRKLTRTWAIVHTIFVIIGAFVIYSMVDNFYTTNNIDAEASTQGTITAGTFIWLFYWIFSKRVKETFVE